MKARKVIDREATIAHTLARHVAATGLADLPAEAVAAARRVMLDTLAVAWAASDTPGSEALRDLAVREGGAADATLLAYGDRVPAAAAALVNGTLAGALDYDCLHEPSVMHCDIAVLPAVLAVAEREGAGGADFLAALVVGNDLACRLGSASSDNGGWFYSSLYGALAAAAAAAKLLRLEAEGIRHAMGIALGSVGGSRQANLERRFTKRMQTAFAAQTGVQAALLARAGVTGPAAILEGDAGIWALYEKGDPRPVLDGLGQSYALAGISLKKYPSCACNHAPTEAAIRLAVRHDLAPAAIAAVRVTVTPYCNGIVGGPFLPSDTPQVEAQFNLSYNVAVALMRRRFGIEEILPPSIFDPSVRAMIDRIAVDASDQGPALMAPATVEVTTTDGRRLSETVTDVPGTPQAPLSDAEFGAKFADCTGRGVDPLTPARARLLMERVGSVESLDDMRRFFDGIVRGRLERQAAE